MEYTGFNSFWTYNAVKYIHFGSKSGDITKGIPKKKVFLKKWNEEMVHRKDSLMFERVDRDLRNKKTDMIKMYSFYCLKNKSFYVTDVLEDEYRAYNDGMWQLNNIKECVENDFLKVMISSVEENIPLKRFFHSSDLPIIYRMYDRKEVSAASLLAMMKAFGMKLPKEEDLNIIQKEKMKHYYILTKKFFPLFQTYFDFDIRDHLRKFHEKLNK